MPLFAGALRVKLLSTWINIYAYALSRAILWKEPDGLNSLLPGLSNGCLRGARLPWERVCISAWEEI